MNKKEIKKQWDAIEDNPLVIVSQMRGMMTDAKDKWADECAQFVDDEDFAYILGVVIKLMNGDHPEYSKIAEFITKLEAYSIKFKMQYNAYMSYKKGTTEANAKKNHYYSMAAGIDKLCDALKYLVKA